MPSPSSLAIATSAVLRLLKEEISYQKELVDQEATIKIFQEKIAAGHTSEDGNDEFMLKQQVMPSKPQSRNLRDTNRMDLANGRSADQGCVRATQTENF